jgi:hypothetical protein
MALPLILARIASTASRIASKAKSVIKARSNAKSVSAATKASETAKRAEAAKTFASLTKKTAPTVKRSEVASSNKLFQKEMANAVRGRPSVLGKKGREKVQTFYRATQSVWQGKPPEERNQAIMNYFDSDSLYQSFLKVMSKQKDVLKPEESLTSTEQTSFYNELEPTEEGDGTPITVYMF